MANTFTVTNNSSGTLAICGENIPAGGTEDIRLDRLVNDPDCTEELAYFSNTNDITIIPPTIVTDRLSIREKQGLDWINNASSFTIPSLKTAQSLNVYANADTGDDANTGRTESAPKKTLQAVFDIIPYVIAHNTVVHLRGTFDNSGRIDKSIAGDNYLLIDGGPGRTEILGQTLADISSSQSIGASGSGWSADIYKGYIVEIVDGPLAGQARTIQSNTSDTLVPCRNFTGDPGSNNFRVVEPDTVFNDAVFQVIDIRCRGTGTVQLQRMSFKGSYYVSFISNFSFGVMSGIVSDCDNPFGAIQVRNSATVFLSDTVRDPATTSPLPTSEDKSGVGQINPVSKVTSDNSEPNLLSSVAEAVVFQRSGDISRIANGSRVGHVTIANTGLRTQALGNIILNSGGYQPTRITGSSGVGLTVQGSEINLGAGIEISGHGSHAIEIDNSFVKFNGDITGSGNGGAGCYLHNRGTAFIDDGAPPTVTGSAGEVSLDGTSEASKWGTPGIDGGTPINGSTVGNDEFVIVKEV